MPNYYTDKNGRTYLFKGARIQWNNKYTTELVNARYAKEGTKFANDLTPYVERPNKFKPEAIGLVYQRGEKRWFILSTEDAISFAEQKIVPVEQIELASGKFRPCNNDEKKFQFIVARYQEELNKLGQDYNKIKVQYTKEYDRLTAKEEKIKEQKYQLALVLAKDEQKIWNQRRYLAAQLFKDALND